MHTETPEFEIDHDFIEILQAEYMDLASKGDRAAFDFAINSSDKFCDISTEVLIRLMEKVPPAGGTSLDTLIMIAAVAMAGRERLLEAFENVSEGWAVAKFQSRRQENLEMQDSWKEETA